MGKGEAPTLDLTDLSCSSPIGSHVVPHFKHTVGDECVTVSLAGCICMLECVSTSYSEMTSAAGLTQRSFPVS